MRETGSHQVARGQGLPLASLAGLFLFLLGTASPSAAAQDAWRMATHDELRLGAFTSTTSTLSEVTRSPIASGGSRYESRLVAFSTAVVGAPVTTAVLQSGVRPFVVLRDERTQKLSPVSGNDPILAAVNRHIDWLDRSTEGRPASGTWVTSLELWPERQDIRALTPRVPATLSVRPGSARGRAEPLLLVSYETDTFAYEVPGVGRVDHKLRGFAVIDAARTTAYWSVHRFEGSIDRGEDPSRTFIGQQTTWLADADGKPVLARDASDDIRAALARFTAVGAEPPSLETTRVPVPKWGPAVVGTSRTAAALLSVEAERHTNPLPIIAVLSVASTVDSAISLGMNLGLLGAQALHGYPMTAEHVFTQLTSDEFSLLNKYGYQRIGRGGAQALAKAGLIEPSEVDGWAEVITGAAKAPSQLLNIANGEKMLVTGAQNAPAAIRTTLGVVKSFRGLLNMGAALAGVQQPTPASSVAKGGVGAGKIALAGAGVIGGVALVARGGGDGSGGSSGTSATSTGAGPFDGAWAGTSTTMTIYRSLMDGTTCNAQGQVSLRISGSRSVPAYAGQTPIWQNATLTIRTLAGTGKICSSVTNKLYNLANVGGFYDPGTNLVALGGGVGGVARYRTNRMDFTGGGFGIFGTLPDGNNVMLEVVLTK
jgi:hypothetical protein